jgi:tetratricopeptide (TPR) repeat protein
LSADKFDKDIFAEDIPTEFSKLAHRNESEFEDSTSYDQITEQYYKEKKLGEFSRLLLDQASHYLSKGKFDESLKSVTQLISAFKDKIREDVDIKRPRDKGVRMLAPSQMNEVETKVIYENDWAYYFFNALILKGIILYTMGRENRDYEYFYKSIPCFDEVIAKCIGGDQMPRAFKNKGNALGLLGRYKEAIDNYERALDLFEDYPAAYTNKGNAFYGLQRYNEALKCYTKALDKLQSGSYKEIYNQDKLILISYLNRGQCNYNLWQVAQAFKDFDKIDDGKITDRFKAIKYNNIGLCYYIQDLYKEALDNFKKAIKFDDRFTYSYYNIAIVYNTLNKKEMAVKSLRRCIKVDENFKEATEATKKFEKSSISDWYDWWFISGVGKKILGVIIIVSVLIMASQTAYFSLTNKSLSDSRMTSLLRMKRG